MNRRTRRSRRIERLEHAHGIRRNVQSVRELTNEELEILIREGIPELRALGYAVADDISMDDLTALILHIDAEEKARNEQ